MKTVATVALACLSLACAAGEPTPSTRGALLAEGGSGGATTEAGAGGAGGSCDRDADPCCGLGWGWEENGWCYHYVVRSFPTTGYGCYVCKCDCLTECTKCEP
jgi:hypothetical protein